MVRRYNSDSDVFQKRYIRSIYYDVEKVLKDSGIPIKLVLAMSAQEIGW